MNTELSIKETIDKIVPHDAGRGDLIPVLQKTQAVLGWLPREAMSAIAGKLGLQTSEVYSVATFYNQFRLKKPAKYVVSICRGTACHVKNSETLLNFAEKLLNIKVGESTADGLITLEIVRCIGACAKAPAVMVNETVYGNMDKDKLKQLLAGLR